MSVGRCEVASSSGHGEFILTDRRIGGVRFVASSFGGIAVVEESPSLFAECVFYCGYGHWGEIAALVELQSHPAFVMRALE